MTGRPRAGGSGTGRARPAAGRSSADGAAGGRAGAGGRGPAASRSTGSGRPTGAGAGRPSAAGSGRPSAAGSGRASAAGSGRPTAGAAGRGASGRGGAGAARRRTGPGGPADEPTGAERKLARERTKSAKPLSASAEKAVVGKYLKQAARSDEGRVRAGRSAERVEFQRRLANAPGQRSDRNDRGLGGTQVEGRQAVRELLIAGKRRVRELWIANDLSDAEVIGDIVDLANDQRVPIVDVSRKRLDAEARSESPQGVLARADELEAVEFEDLLKRRGPRPPFLVALDGVTDPGNLGAVLRSADGAGVSGVLLPKHRAVHITPTAAKSAAGAVEHLNIAVVPGLPAALARCRQAGLWVVGLDDAADRSLFDLGDLAADAVVLVLGAEGAGLSRLARERCDLIVSIPMLGRLSSLNVSNAGALALYEIARQRALKAGRQS